MSNYIRIITFCILWLTSFNAFPQYLKNWEVGGWLGGSSYFGDLNTNSNLLYTRPAGGLLARRNFSPYLAWKTSLNAGYLTFQDAASKYAFQEERNLSFSSFIADFSSQVEINFFKYKPGDKKFFYTPYILTGLSGVFFSPTTRRDGQRYDLADYNTEAENYSKINMASLLGGGLKYNISRKWNLGFEIGYRATFTDYLDDVSSSYASGYPDEISSALADRSLSGTLGTPGKQRGNKENNDAYMMAGINITYTIFQFKCPNYF